MARLLQIVERVGRSRRAAVPLRGGRLRRLRLAARRPGRPATAQGGHRGRRPPPPGRPRCDGGPRPGSAGHGLPHHAPRRGRRRAASPSGAAQSHDAVAVSPCLVAHPLVDELVADGRFPDGEVVLRAGARTGERLVVVDGDSAQASVPEGVRVVSSVELAAGQRAWIHEEVAGRRWRISARSFFQARPDGAEALVAAVGDAAAPWPNGDRLVDLYGGVGLFAGHAGGRRAGHRGGAERLGGRRRPASTWPTSTPGSSGPTWATGAPLARTCVVADPPRQGLGPRGVAAGGRHRRLPRWPW